MTSTTAPESFKKFHVLFVKCELLLQQIPKVDKIPSTVNTSTFVQPTQNSSQLSNGSADTAASQHNSTVETTVSSNSSDVAHTTTAFVIAPTEAGKEAIIQSAITYFQLQLNALSSLIIMN